MENSESVPASKACGRSSVTATSEGPVMTGASLTARMETSSELSAVLAPPEPMLPKSSVRKDIVATPSKSAGGS